MSNIILSTDLIAPDKALQVKRENEVAMNVAEYLQGVYPDHQWACNCDLNGGVVHIYNLNLSGKWGFLMKVKDVVEDGWKKKIMQAGGELLERYRMSRGRFKQAQYEALNVDKFGNHIADK